jgi:cell division protein FtsZ
MVFTEFLNNEADKIAELDLSKEKGIDANENELKKNLDSVEEIDINYNKVKSYEQSSQKDNKMSLNISVPEDEPMSRLTPKITVIGVGGAGGNAVNTMINANLQGARFLAANTDAQALSFSLADKRLQLGLETTKGLGSGMNPEVGRAAAEEAIDSVIEEIKDSNMLFIAVGMGGGTGTGAAPVIARAAKELGILTVGVVTKPFNFEGKRRMMLAEQGIEELEKYVDTIIIIPNQNLFRITTEKTSFADAFKMADNVLYAGVRNITDLIMVPGLINLDFADVCTVISGMGRAMMGSGEATGENRAIEAAEAAITNQLLDDNSMHGAKGILINITGGMDLTLFDVDAAAEKIKEEVDVDANIIVGTCLDPSLDGTMRVSVVATGIAKNAGAPAKQEQKSENILRKAMLDTPKPAAGRDFLREKTDLFSREKSSDAFASARQEIDKIFASAGTRVKPGFKEEKPEDVPAVAKDTVKAEEKTVAVAESERVVEEKTVQEEKPEQIIEKKPVDAFIPNISALSAEVPFSSGNSLMNFYEESSVHAKSSDTMVATKPAAPAEDEKTKHKGSFFERVTKFTLGSRRKDDDGFIGEEVFEDREEKNMPEEKETSIDISSDTFSIPSYLRGDKR